MSEQISANDYNNLVLRGVIKHDKNGRAKINKGIPELIEHLKRKQIEAGMLFAKEQYDYVSGNTFRELLIELPGEPIPKQSTRFMPESYFQDGTHICPYTGVTLQHKKGDVKTVLMNGMVRCFVHAYTDSTLVTKTKEYQTMIKAQLPNDFKPFENEVHILSLDFVFTPLKSFSDKKLKAIESSAIVYKNTRPDQVDNLKKLPFDAMNGLIYKDDSIVVNEQNIRKYYGVNPGVFIKLKGF